MVQLRNSAYMLYTLKSTQRVLHIILVDTQLSSQSLTSENLLFFSQSAVASHLALVNNLRTDPNNQTIITMDIQTNLPGQ